MRKGSMVNFKKVKMLKNIKMQKLDVQLLLNANKIN